VLSGGLLGYFLNAFKMVPVPLLLLLLLLLLRLLPSGLQHHAILFQNARFSEGTAHKAFLNFDATDIFKTLVYFCYTADRLQSVPSAKENIGEGAQYQNYREVRTAVKTVANNTGQGLPSLRNRVNRCIKCGGGGTVWKRIWIKVGYGEI